MTVSLTVYETYMYTVQHQRVVPCHWKCCRSIDHVRPTKSCVLVRHCKYSSILYRFQLFDVEKYRDLKILVRGHSRSFKLVPFESLGKVSYSPSIVTMALSCIISEIKRDIARKSWCFHTRLHSTPPSVSEYFHPVWYRTIKMVRISADVKTEDMCNRLVPWLSGRTLVLDRRAFAVLRSTYSWPVTTYVGKPSAVCQPTRPTQPFIHSGSINE